MGGYSLKQLGMEELSTAQFKFAKDSSKMINSIPVDYSKNIAQIKKKNKKWAKKIKSDTKFSTYSSKKLDKMVRLVLDSLRLKLSYFVHADNMCFFKKFQSQYEFDVISNDFKNALLNERHKNIFAEKTLWTPLAVSGFAPFHGIQVPFDINLTRLIAESFCHHFFPNPNKFQHKPSRWRFTMNRPIRIGFMSTDIRRHPMFQVMRGVFQYYDKSKYEIYVYITSRADPKEFALVSKWVDNVNTQFESMTTKQRLHTIRKDKIQVLVDLNLHTWGKAREVLIYKAAPIQISYAGYPGTSGMDAVDYLVADERAIPASVSSGYSEKIIYLPQTWLLNSHEAVHADILKKYNVNRAEFKLPSNSIVFANFGRPFKVDGETFDTWCSILKRVPNSVLWVIEHHDDTTEKFSRFNFRVIMKQHGIDPDRLIVTPKIPDGRHIAAATLADIFLDTPKYNGGMTSIDTLWAGIPLVTMPGKQSKMPQRMGISLCYALGMPEMVVTSQSEYEETAVTLALDTTALTKLRQRLQKAKKRKPGLFDTIGGVNALLKGFSMAWERFMNGENPDNIYVSQKKQKKQRKHRYKKKNIRKKRKNDFVEKENFKYS